MNKKIVFFVIFWILFIGHLSAQTLTVRIENVDIGKGHLMIGVFNDERSFPDTHFRGERIEAINSVMIIVFPDLPVGQYAVSVYQDSNNNGQLDTGIFGIPKEKYGFSNGVRKPDFKQSRFDFNGNMTITIQIR